MIRKIAIALLLALAAGILFRCMTSSYLPAKESLPGKDGPSMLTGNLDYEFYEKFAGVLPVSKFKNSQKTVALEFMISKYQSFYGVTGMHIRIYTDKTGEMVYKFSNDWDNYGRDKEIFARSIQLKEQQCKELIQVFNRADFWNLPPYTPDEPRLLDGSGIVIEGVNHQNYNIISMQVPDLHMFPIERIYDAVDNYRMEWNLN